MGGAAEPTRWKLATLRPPSSAHRGDGVGRTDYHTPVPLPLLPSQVPREGGPLSRRLGAWVLSRAGWRVAGNFPDLPKFVCIMAPHTSNWDFFVGVAVKYALGVRAVWIGKHSLFRWPINGFLRGLGGIPVERGAPHAVVQQIADEFAARDQMIFALAPEGTRKRVERWRSGYWHVAHLAGVPIVPVAFDFALRTVFIGPPITTSDSIEADEKRLRDYVRGVVPKRPELYVA